MKQIDYFNSGITRDLSFRIESIKRLSKAIERNEKEILSALKSDLNKSETEGYMTELGVLKGDIKYILKRVRKWTKPQRVGTELALLPAKCFRIGEPYGVVLIMSPWNYPFLLSLEPLVGAIAAGNCVTLKPSAYSPATSAVIAKIISECFSPEFCTVVQGGRAENAGLLEQKFDYIFFTGGISVGKLVMEAAAKHLTPISLELGGKSPVIVDESADIDLAAKRLVFGKYINAGQTCVAPDYVLVHQSKKEELLERLGFWIEEFYPKGADGVIQDYPRIINEKHFKRIEGLMSGEKILFGGVCSSETLTITPAVMPEVTFDSPVMQEEIFGPLLPILTYSELDEAISAIKSRPKPLALYLFSRDKAIQKRVLRDVSFGGGCINDVLMHVATSRLPFGGVGESGMGAYHGKASFDTFTHYKSIVHKGALLDPSVRYRPYTPLKKKLIRRLF